MPSEKELNAAVLARMKADRDRKVWEAAPIDPNALEWKRTSFGLPGVMALVLSKTLAHVAGNDRHMAQWAVDIEKRARAVIRVFLSRREPNEKAH